MDLDRQAALPADEGPMLYLSLSLALLAVTPFLVRGVERYRLLSQVFAFLMIAAIAYNIFAHILFEHIEHLGAWALLAAGLGLIIFSYGDHFFFPENPQRRSGVFIILLQIFLFVHAATDGAALIGSNAGDSLVHDHGQKLGQSVLLHRVLFEAFIWKYFADKFGQRAAFLVLVNIAVGTLLGYFAGQEIFKHVPSAFDFFEVFMGGALLHMVYDYIKETFTGHRHQI